MPTRLIIAYLLILLIAAGLSAALFAATAGWRGRRRMRRRGLNWRRARRAELARERRG